MKSRNILIAVGALAAAAALRRAVRPSRADKLVFKASDVHPHRLSDRGRGRGHGQETVDRHQGPALSVADVSVDAARRREGSDRAGQVGAIAFARVSVGALGPVVDDLNVFNLPYVFRNTAHMEKVIDGEDRPGAARQDHQQRQGPHRPVLDGCRRAQFLQHQAADQDARRSQGSEDPRHGQPDVRRHGERDGRQRRAARLRPGVHLAADRRGRRRREQPAELRVRQPLPGGEVLHHRRAPDRAGNAGDVEEDLRHAVEGRAGRL